MANNDKITIEVKQVINTANESKKLLEDFKKLKTDNNKKDFDKAKSNLAKMEAYSQTKDFSKESLKEFRKSFNDFIKSMFNIAETNIKADEKLKKLYEKERSLREAINREEELKNKERSKITIRKNGDIVPSDSREIMRQNGGVYRATGKTDENGNQIISKVMEVNFSNVLKKMDEGFKYFDIKGNPIENIGWWQDLTKIGPNAVKTIKEHQDNIDKTSQELLELQQEIDKLEKNTEELSGDFSSLKSVANLHEQGNKIINEQFSNYETKANAGRADEYEKDYQKAINNDNVFKKQSSSIGAALKSFSIYAVTLKFAKKAANEAKKAILELDRAITQQAMVTGKSREEIKALIPQYSELARVTGSTTKEVAGVATQFLRQGKTVKQTLELTEAAISAARVAGISASESVNFLTTALNGFQLSASNAMKVSDKFAAIASSSATSYEELATALSKVASQANLAGMSIDYTTALLAKGVETTREAPETIGTALKTIIARMRELTDYGATLEDGININNVEKQLAYVNIALRDSSGELRSTEDVLDELGKKWNTLTVNQQAAIAKALAGTRQQSRLIAMMTNYERVIELQEIAEDSAGATAAQMGEYMKGLDASLNRITQAWNSFIEGLNEDSAINDIVKTVAGIAEFLADNWKLVAIIISGILADHLLMNSYQKIKNALLNDELTKENKKKKIEKEQLKAEKDIALQKAKQALSSAQDLKSTLERKKATKGLSAEEQDILNTIDEEIDQRQRAVTDAETEYNLAKKELDTFIEENETRTIGEKITEKIRQSSLILSIIQAGIVTLQKILNKDKKKENQETDKAIGKEAAVTAEKSTQAIVKTGEAAAAQQWHAVAAAAGILAVAGISVVGSLAALGSIFGGETEEEKTNNLINSTYNLRKESNALKSILTEVKQINGKIVKTSTDNERLQELYDQVEQYLSDEDKQAFNESMKTIDRKISFLEEKIVEKNTEAKKKNNELLTQTKVKTKGSFGSYWIGSLLGGIPNVINMVKTIKNGGNFWQAAGSLLFNRSSEKVLNEDLTPSQIRTGWTNMLDFEKQEGTISENMKNIVETYFDQLSDEELKSHVLGKTAEEQQQYVDSIIASFRELEMDLEADGLAKIDVAKNALYKAQKQNKDEKFEQAILDYYGTDLSVLGFSGEIKNEKGEKIKFSDFLSSEGITYEDLASMLGNVKDIKEIFGTTLGTNDDTIKENFTKILQNVFTNMALGDTMKDAWNKALQTTGLSLNNKEVARFASNIMIKGYGGASEVITKIKNDSTELKKVWDDFFNWDSMTADEQLSFIQENSKLFEDHPEAMEYLETRNYQEFAKILAESHKAETEALLKQLDDSIEALEMQEDVDEAYLKLLKEYRNKIQKQLEDNDYLPSLEKLLDEEEKKLSEFRNFLEKRNEALVKALEKRKEAYQKYFDEINNLKEDEDFDQQAELLSTNISKLQGSYGDTEVKRKELEKQLEELEKNRLDSLRQRSQEQIIKNIDDEIQNANEFLDDIHTDSEKALELMNKFLEQPEKFYNEYMKTMSVGMTDLQIKQLANNFENIFSTYFDKEDREKIENQYYITLNNEQITNTVEEEDLVNAIQKIAEKYGYIL